MHQMRNFRGLMAKAGDLEVMGTPYARMQILSVSQILEGERFDTPSVAGRRSRQAPNYSFRGLKQRTSTTGIGRTG